MNGINPNCLPDQMLQCIPPADRAKLGKAGQTHAEATAKSLSRLEKDDQAEIVQFCNLKGWKVQWQRTDRKATGSTGVPDLIIALPGGVTAWIECKRANGRLRPEQLEWLRYLDTSGHDAKVCRSVAEAIDFLKGLAL